MASDPIISFIGAGNMGEAMLRGLAKSGHSKSRLKAFDVRSEWLHHLAADAGFTAVDSLERAVEGSDLLVLAVKPQSFAGLLASLGPLIRGGTGDGTGDGSGGGACPTIVSIAAGVRLESLHKALGQRVRLVRVMPNTPGLIGQGVSAYCLSQSANEAQAKQTEALLKPLGKVLRVLETDMDAVTALSGSGPAYVFLFMEALQAAAEGLGLGPDAVFLLAGQTLAGAAAMIQARKQSPAELRVAVTSPGGTTAAALKVFEDGGFRALVDRALRAARDRSAQLGQD